MSEQSKFVKDSAIGKHERIGDLESKDEHEKKKVKIEIEIEKIHKDCEKKIKYRENIEILKKQREELKKQLIKCKDQEILDQIEKGNIPCAFAINKQEIQIKESLDKIPSKVKINYTYESPLSDESVVENLRGIGEEGKQEIKFRHEICNFVDNLETFQNLVVFEEFDLHDWRTEMTDSDMIPGDWDDPCSVDGTVIIPIWIITNDNIKYIFIIDAYLKTSNFQFV